MPISLMLIQETANSLLSNGKAEPGGGAADQTLVQSSTSCTGPNPSEPTDGEALSAASVVRALFRFLRKIFNIKETDPFCKMVMSHKPYVIEERQGEPVSEAHIPYNGDVSRDCKNEPSTAILDL